MTKATCFLTGCIVGILVFGAVMLLWKMKLFQTSADRVIEYRSVAGNSLKLHVFAAEHRTKGRPPAILLFHGGAWQYGNPSQFFPQCKVFSQRGITCISAEYRISSRHGTDPKASLEDAIHAFNFVSSNAQELNIDTARIAVGGGSAGGHLAAALSVKVPLVAATEAILPRPSATPRALILYNPMVNLAPCHPDHHLVQSYWHSVSPYQHVTSNVPPTLFLVGDQDVEVPLSTAKGFCDLIKSAGVVCELTVYEGAKHGFFNYRKGNPFFTATNERVISFLRRQYNLDN